MENPLQYYLLLIVREYLLQFQKDQAGHNLLLDSSWQRSNKRLEVPFHNSLYHMASTPLEVPKQRQGPHSRPQKSTRVPFKIEHFPVTL